LRIPNAIACFAAMGANAQDGTVSPYSYFGIGDIRAKATIENQMMGGLGMYADSIHVNLQNPAAYGKLGLTVYSAGLSYNRLSLSSTSSKESNQLVNLDYLALGFNVGKGWGVGFGIRPLTSVGYNIVSESTTTNDDGTISNVTNQYSGEGGLNKVYFSLGYQITKDLSLGVTTNFNFGTINNLRTQIIEDVQFGALDDRTSRINGFDLNYAINYTPTIKEKYTLYTSARVNTQANLTSRNTQEIGSYSTSTGRNIEIINVNLAARGLQDTGLKIPTTTTLGLGYGQNKKWFLGAEYSFQGLSSFTNEFVRFDNVSYQDASTIAFGGYFIPDYTSYNGYLKRITYRAGVRMENTGMIVNNEEINNFGITFGLGLPLSSAAGGFSNINLGFEIGKRGTTEMMLIEENYFKINIGLSLNDKWFLKRKIN